MISSTPPFSWAAMPLLAHPAACQFLLRVMFPPCFIPSASAPPKEKASPQVSQTKKSLLGACIRKWESAKSLADVLPLVTCRTHTADGRKRHSKTIPPKVMSSCPKERSSLVSQTTHAAPHSKKNVGKGHKATQPLPLQQWLQLSKIAGFAASRQDGQMMGWHQSWGSGWQNQAGKTIGLDWIGLDRSPLC